MATPTTFAAQKQYLGWAKEVTQGTPVTPGTAWMPIDSFAPEDKPTWLDDKALRGSMGDIYGRIQGPIHTEFSIAAPAYMDLLPWFLINILGDVTDAGSAPNTHAVALLNSGTAQPGSLTLISYAGMPATTAARMYAGACLSELTISGNADSTLVSMTAKGMAWPGVDYPSSAPVPSFGAVPAQAAWRYALGLGGIASGGTQNKTVREWSITITRALRVENTLQNSQSPYIIQRGMVGVSGSLTFTVPSDETALNYLMNNTQPQLQIKGDNGGAGATLYGLQIDAQLCAFDTVKIKTDEEALGYDATFIGVNNSTNAGASGGLSPIKVTVTNQTASY